MSLSYYFFALCMLVLVIGMILLFSYALKRWGGHLIVKSPTSREKTLSLVSVAAIDGKRRLVVAKWKDKEYLLLTGGENDLVIDQKPADPDPRKPETPEELLT